ncbi:MAG TPA: TIGR01777 family oxidoreductase [Jatrophihabitans sp.]|nr:TIGR01777 family oxidoreductase [Jatrophihabitans sp.]
MRVLIGGGSGFLGQALARELITHRHLVHTLVRRPTKTDSELEWHPERGELDPDLLRSYDAVVGLSGAGIGDRRWTADYKRELLDSRLQPTGTLATALAQLPADERPACFLNASAIGYYGDRGDLALPESAVAGTGFLADLVARWEAATEPAAQAGVRVLTLRTGLVLSASGGLLKRLIPLFKLGIGGRLGSGQQFQSWISLADEVAAIRHLLTADQVAGPVNLTGPDPVRNDEFSSQLGRALHRPALLPAPAFGIRLALGEFADEGALASQRAIPQQLLDSGYEFQHPDLASALAWAVRN